MKSGLRAIQVRKFLLLIQLKTSREIQWRYRTCLAS